MGRRDRQRKRRVLHGEEPGYRRLAKEAELVRNMDALEAIAEEFGGDLVASELERLGKEGKLRI